MICEELGWRGCAAFPSPPGSCGGVQEASGSCAGGSQPYTAASSQCWELLLWKQPWKGRIAFWTLCSQQKRLRSPGVGSPWARKSWKSSTFQVKPCPSDVWCLQRSFQQFAELLKFSACFLCFSEHLNHSSLLYKFYSCGSFYVWQNRWGCLQTPPRHRSKKGNKDNKKENNANW